MSPYQGYLSSSTPAQDIYKAIHVDGSKKTQVFQAQNDLIYQSLLADINADYTSWYDWLQSKKYVTLIYLGEWDHSDGPTSIKQWLRNSRYLGNEIWTDSRKIFLVNNTAASGETVVGGYWRSDPLNLINLLTLAKAGHSALRENMPVLKQAITDMLT